MKLLEHFKELSLHPKNAEELKGLILQLAVQGKLTANWREEHPDVEPASVILEKIEEEKQQLIAEKKIKKEKPLPPIVEGEVPYELPHGWVWCRLNEVCEYIQRGKSPKYTEEPKIPVISQKCVQWSGFDISRARFITEESLEKYGQERFLQNGDLLWNSTGDGTIGRVISYPGSDYDRVVADSHVTVVRGFKEYINTNYLWIFTASPLIQNLVAGRVSGSTKQTELGTGTVKSMEFSFPPLEEQKAIVEVVNTLFAEVGQLESLTKERIQLKQSFVVSALNRLTESEKTQQEWNFLQQYFSSFFTEKKNIKSLRETILQLAVQGKLTAKWRANNPNTEPASELLKQIEAEKQQLIAEKKIKKEKALAPIGNDDIPYELTEGWVWCRLGSISLIVGGGTPKSSNPAFFSEDGIPWFTPADLGKSKTKFVNKGRRDITELGLQKSSAQLMPAGSVLFSSRAPIGHTAIGLNDFCTNQGFKSARPYIMEMSEYIYYYLNSIVKEANENASGTTFKEVSGAIVKNFLFPLPPLEEQQAIVEKANSLMSLCDELEQQIETSHTHVEQLMKSCLKEVFEQA